MRRRVRAAPIAERSERSRSKPGDVGRMGRRNAPPVRAAPIAERSEQEPAEAQRRTATRQFDCERVREVGEPAQPARLTAKNTAPQTVGVVGERIVVEGVHDDPPRHLELAFELAGTPTCMAGEDPGDLDAAGDRAR